MYAAIQILLPKKFQMQYCEKSATFTGPTNRLSFLALASILCKCHALWLRLYPEALQEPQPEPKLDLKVSAEGVRNPSSHLAAACLLSVV